MDANRFSTYAESLSKTDLVRSLVQAKEAFDVAVDLLHVLSHPDTSEEALAAARVRASGVVEAYTRAEEQASHA